LLGVKAQRREDEAQNSSLRQTIVELKHENQLLKRRLFGNKTERTQTSELQLALGSLLDEEKQLQKQLDEAVANAAAAGKDGDGSSSRPSETTKAKPKGRRDLLARGLPQVPLEILDPELEKTAKRIGFERSLHLMHIRGGFKVLVKLTAKYEVPGKDGPTVLGVQAPRTLFPRGILHSSAVAHIVVQKFSLGVPHYRLEQHLQDQGVELGRGMMCRYVEEAGNALGATIVHAMLLIPPYPIRQSGGTRSAFRGSDQRSERSDGWAGRSGSGDGVRLGFETFLAAQGGTAQGDDVSVVDEPIADGVGDSRIAESLVPSFRRQLRREYGGVLSVPVLEHLEQVTALDVVQRSQQEVVEDEHIDFGDARERAGVVRRRTCDRQLLEQARNTDEKRTEALADCGLGERVREEALAHAGGPKHDEVVVGAHPLAVGKVAECGALEATCWVAENLLRRSANAQASFLDTAGDFTIFAVGPLLVDEQAQLVLEGEVPIRRHFQHLT
jgi:transposase